MSDAEDTEKRQITALEAPAGTHVRTFQENVAYAIAVRDLSFFS